MNNIKNTFAVVALFFCVVIICSCEKSEDEDVFSRQEEDINTYVQGVLHENFQVYHKEGSGVWRVVEKPGSGDDVVVRGSKIKIDYFLYLFDSRSERGEGVLIYADESDPDDEWLTVGGGELITGLDIGVVGAKLNETCQIVFSGRYGYGDKQVGLVPKMQPLSIRVTIKELKND